MEELIGSVDQDEFVRGLLLAHGVETSGDIWEQLITNCDHCLFVKQCEKISDAMEQLNKNPRCGQIVEMLMGELKPEDVPVQDF